MMSGYLQTAELIGNITMYEGEIVRSILIKKSRILEQFRQAVASILKKWPYFRAR